MDHGSAFQSLIILLLLPLDILAHNGDPWFQRMKRPAWWQDRQRQQGPNVCAVESVVGTNRKYFTPWSGGSICELPTVIKFECCEGFSMMNDEVGCPLARRMENIVESVKGNGVTALAHAIQASGLSKSLATEGPLTLFAPINQAFLNASEETIYSLNRKTALQGAPPSLLMYHLVSDRIFFNQLQDEMMIPSLYYRQPLRINSFGNGLVTVNCIPLVSVDLEATNGIIHMVENIIKAPSQNPITDYVVREHAFGRMATILVHSKVTNMLREKGPFTLFVPTDEAFGQIPPEHLELIMNDIEALTALVKYHIVDGIWCSSTVTDKMKLRTQADKDIFISCNATEKFINEAKIVQPDIITANGVIHVIDQVLMPDKAKSLKEIAEELELTTLLSLLNSSGLINVLTDSGKFTVLAPADSAFEALSNETIQDLEKELLQDILMAHIIPNVYYSKSLNDQQLLPTLKLRHRIRIKVSRKRVTVDEALIESADHEGRNGIIHVIDEVLIPPKLTITQYLLTNNFSTFTLSLNHTTPRLLDLLDTGKGPFTVFAPDDYSFTLLPPGHLARMLGDSNIMTGMMNDHIIEDYVTSKILLPNVYYTFRTRSHRSLHLHEENGFITAGISLVRQPNIICTNGVVHRVNRLIQLH